MNNSRMEKVGAAFGIVFVGLLVATFFTTPQPPFVSDSTDKILDFYFENQNGILLTAMLSTMATAAFLWFAGTLLSHLRAAEQPTGRVSVIGFGGAIGAATLFSASAAIQGSLALSIGESSPEIARAMFNTGYMMGAVVQVVFLVWVYAVVLVIFRTRALPVGLGWLGAINALVGLYGIFAIYSEAVRDSLEGPLGLVSFLWILAWVLLLAFVLMMRIGKAASVESA